MTKSSILKKVLLAGVAVASMSTLSTVSKAAVIDLGFIVDSSGSIGSSNFDVIKAGLANAVNNVIPNAGAGADDYRITVVNFSSTAVTVLDQVLVTAASKPTIAAAINGMSFLGNTTDYAAAFNAMATALGNTTQSLAYVNFATDGVPDSTAAANTARNALIASGVDNLSIEGIGGGVDVAYLTGSICYPSPCDSTDPYNFPAQGFYISVANAAAYAAAIDHKIAVVTNQVPEPATLAVLGMGLLGLGIARRRKA